jgi:hypothetical protein
LEVITGSPLAIRKDNGNPPDTHRNDLTMNKMMIKAAKHFKVPKEEEEHWMSTYAHIVRDG